MRLRLPCVAAIEIDLTYEGIETYRRLLRPVHPLIIEIDLTYEGIETLQPRQG